jgi:ABC-type siderophore export system fused ATPase/permease subunit
VIGKKDYSSEIIAFCALAVLSELSHFWYIMIAILVAMSFAGILTLLSKIYLHARMVRENDLCSSSPVVLAKPRRQIMLEPAHESRAVLPLMQG